MGTSCITSGNIVITIDDLPTIHAVHGIDIDSLQSADVDLTTNSDWQDHKADLIAVDDIGFACKIQNNTGTVATGQAYISDKPLTTVAAVRSDGVKILDGISVAANSTKTITWDESYNYLLNFDASKKIVFGEIFHLYFITSQDNFDITVKDLTLFLTVTGKP
jgi:hypothetical protein